MFFFFDGELELENEKERGKQRRETMLEDTKHGRKPHVYQNDFTDIFLLPLSTTAPSDPFECTSTHPNVLVGLSISFSKMRSAARKETNASTKPLQAA
jgi:hypothetical protein